MEREQISELKSLLGSALSSIDRSEEISNALMMDLLDTFIKMRRLRNDAFPDGYFADTAWDILIDIFEAHKKGQVLCTTALAVDSKAPLATVLRYLKKLETDGYLIRFQDSVDRRRTMVQITEKGAEIMDSIFSKASPSATEAPKKFAALQ